MSQLLSIASGNASSASTWGLVDATSFVSSTETATVLTTSRVGATTFTPGAITIIGIAVKLAVRTGTTGTITVDLDQGGSLVTGTDVTINVSDLPVAATADLNGGWHYFEFASPVTLSAATAYSVKAKTSSSSQVSLFATSSSNWCRCLVTTTTQAPTTGDNMIVCGKYTGAGASTSYTVTWDITATTDFGSTPTAANSLLAPGICVCNKGTLAIAMSASTNYNMKMSNSIIVYSGGVFNMCTVGSEMPRTSSFTLQFDCGANVDYGLTVRNLGTWTSQGLSRTVSKNIYYCKLNTDEAANSTSLGVDTDTGWLDNDEIAVASTTRTATDCEAGTLNGAGGASSLTVDGFAGSGGGLLVAHSGTSPTQAEVILLTRNVKLIGASASLQAYIDIKATATVDVDWTEFKWLGSATTNKRGIDIATTTGSCSFNYCSLRNFEVASSTGFNITSTSGSNITISNNVTWNIANVHISNANTTGNYTIDSNISIKNITSNVAIINLSGVGIIFTNNTIAGSVSTGILLQDTSVVVGTFSGNTIHSCASRGLLFGANNAVGGTLSSCNIWRNTTYGIETQGVAANYTINDFILFGNSTASIGINGGQYINCVFYNCSSNGDSTFSTPSGITASSNGYIITCINCSFGVASGIKTTHTQDINISSTILQINLINCLLSSGTEISGQTSLPGNSFISSQKHDQTTGLHKLWKRYGTITIDTTNVYSGTTSMQMKPNNATNKLQSIGPSGGFKVAVASGQTCTPTVWIAEDGTYNGNRTRLIVLRNDALGITSDTVLATATGYGTFTWQSLSGTTAAVTDNGVLEFCIEIDGTVGNVYCDLFSAIVT